MIVYGPVPSRRLEQSVGINNIPPKTCPYSCIYCQLGRTNHMQIERQAFYQPEEICREAEDKLRELKAEHRRADYFSFVPDGEPTLDLNLGKTIRLLKPYGVKIAVITNASLLWMDEVKEDLMDADWVSVSMDAAGESAWRKIDRPHGKLSHAKILKGIEAFADVFPGTLVTETMLVESVNDQEVCLKQLAEELARVQPGKAYLLVPTRPPAEPGVRRAAAGQLQRAAALIESIAGTDVECITGGDAEAGFFAARDIAEELLSIAAVHPIREDIAEALLSRRSADRAVLDRLTQAGKLSTFSYEGKKFYRRAFERHFD